MCRLFLVVESSTTIFYANEFNLSASACFD